MTFCGSNPWSRSMRSRKPLTMRTAPASRTSASATWEATKKERKRRVLGPVVAPRSSSFSASSRSVLEARQAGAMPEAMPARRATAVVNRSARRSRWMLFHPAIHMAIPGDRFVRIRSTPSCASHRAQAPPRSAGNKFSARRTTRARPAPSASLTATSLPRSVARVRNRPVTLAQAIRRTNAAAPWKTRAKGAVIPNCCSRSRTRLTPRPVLVRGYCAPSRPARAFISTRARASVTPGFSLARTSSDSRSRWPRSSSVRESGAQRSTPPSGKLKVGGMTPTTVQVRPSTSRLRDRTAGSAPK